MFEVDKAGIPTEKPEELTLPPRESQTPTTELLPIDVSPKVLATNFVATAGNMGYWNEPPDPKRAEAGMQANFSSTQSRDVNSGAASPPLTAEGFRMPSTYKHWFKLNTDLPNSPSVLENQLNQTVKADGGSPMSMSEAAGGNQVEGTPMGKMSPATQRLEEDSNRKGAQALILKSTTPFQQRMPKDLQVEGV